MVSDDLKDLLRAGVEKLRADSIVPAGLAPAVELQRPTRPEHGEFATNLALTIAGQAKMPPRKLAEELVSRLPASELVEKAEVAGPGFINFHLSHRWLESTLRDVAFQREGYGR